MTNDEIMAEIRSGSPFDKARALFSSWSARIEQEQHQRDSISPIEARGLEFEAVKAIIAAYHEPIAYVTQECVRLMRDHKGGFMPHIVTTSTDQVDKDGKHLVALYVRTVDIPPVKA